MNIFPYSLSPTGYLASESQQGLRLVLLSVGLFVARVVFSSMWFHEPRMPSGNSAQLMCLTPTESWGHLHSQNSAMKQVVGKINTTQGTCNFPKSLLKKISMHMLYHTHKPNAFQALSFCFVCFFYAPSEIPKVGGQEKNVIEHRKRDI